VSPDGATLFAVGIDTDNSGITQGVTVAYDTATGAILWVGQPEASVATSVVVSPDGSTVFVTGYLNGARENYATVAYRTGTGAVLWVQLYKGPNGRSMAMSIAASPDGSTVFVTGRSGVPGGEMEDYATVAYAAATGAVIWAKRYAGGPSSTGASSVAVSPDGSTVFVTGTDESASHSFDYGTVAYAAATGSVLWARRYGGASLTDNQAVSVVPSPDGTKVFITGYSAGGAHPQFGYATVAYSA
jgi:WD40 repeat protein